MNDAFSVLSEPRRPWVDLDQLKARFREMSSPLHPDRFQSASAEEQASANARYTELNSAYNQLREARERLPLLIELESGAPPRDIQRIPPGTMDLFVEVGQACRDCDAFLPRLTAATSPMLKLQVMREGLEWADQLQVLQGRVRSKQEELETELRQMNPVWERAPETGTPGRAATLPLERLEQIYRGLSYVARWTEQLQERIVQLAIG
jgi:hypothetical protein